MNGAARVLFVWLLVSQSVAAEVVVDRQEFGFCSVISQVDEFTDETRNHALICDDDADGEGGIAVACYPLLWSAVLHVEGQYHADGDEVPVRYRFDKDKAYSSTWKTASNIAFTFSDSAVRRFLEDLSRDGVSIIFEVDGEMGRIMLSPADGRRAVREFEGRCVWEPAP